MRLVFVFLFVFGLGHATVHADEAKIKVDTSSGDQDTSIVIHKGPTGSVPAVNQQAEYKIVEDTEEVAGEPVSGQQESYESWKKACSDWRKELKEDNGKNLISASCGRPHIETDSVTMKKTQISTGRYKLKVLVKEASK